MHQILLGCGYRYTKTQHLPQKNPLLIHDKATGFYVKEYSTAGGAFKIALSFSGDPHIELPDAYVLNSPEQYRGCLLPHINFGWYLCYVEEMEADWNPNDLDGTYHQVDQQIQLTLDSSVSSVVEGTPDDVELEGEFSSYWLGDKTVYLLSEAEEGQNLQCLVAIAEPNKARPISKENEEWVAYHASHESECKIWLKQRSLMDSDSARILTRGFKIKPSRLAGVSWPPEDLKSVFEWLSEVDRAALIRILEHFVTNPVKRHLLLLDVLHQDMVALYVEFNLKATALGSYSVKKSRQKGTGRTVKHNALATGLSGKTSCNKFDRLSVTRADRKTILTRNRPRPEVGDLSGKRIALIGCGTIGGYLSGLLLRAGAGCGKGNFHLYDGDTFGPQNYGRHALTVTHFGQNKAVALAENLKSTIHLASQIEGIPLSFPITTEHLRRYDIVIDATGRPPVSKRLAKLINSMSSEQRPIVVHGFNDGNGRSSKVIVDDGHCCYGCLQADPTFYNQDGVDLRFKDIDHKSERHISCGSTYTPYDAAVSVITASMMQEAVLASLEPERPWTYSEHMFDGSRSRSSRHLSRQPKCGICYG
ncbi:E2/UBC family protein [Undibacterium luofuense]|nr:E2/UBC family protein [Undibacterium luofuense]